MDDCLIKDLVRRELDASIFIRLGLIGSEIQKRIWRAFVVRIVKINVFVG